MSRTRWLFALVSVSGCTANPRPAEAAVSTADDAVKTPRGEPGATGRNSDGTPRRFPPAPADLPGTAYVYSYADFGPQALAGQLLGPELYSFGAGCCYEPDDSFDVRVVVYGIGMKEAEARARWPSGPTLGDYRYLSATDAALFLGGHLREMSGWPDEDRIPTLEARLAATVARMRSQFPALAQVP